MKIRFRPQMAEANRGGRSYKGTAVRPMIQVLIFPTWNFKRKLNFLKIVPS